jgi:hypothetical protein
MSGWLSNECGKSHLTKSIHHSLAARKTGFLFSCGDGPSLPDPRSLAPGLSSRRPLIQSPRRYVGIVSPRALAVI